MNLLITPQEPEIIPVGNRLINLAYLQMNTDSINFQREGEDIIVKLRGKGILVNGKEVKIEVS